MLVFAAEFCDFVFLRIRLKGNRAQHMSQREVLLKKVEDLRSQQRELDDAIKELAKDSHANQVEIQGLKKRKLKLKDQIVSFENQLLPDIIA